MKVLVINSYYYPNIIGGAERSTQLIAEGMKRAGHDVMVFCLKHAKDEEVNGVKIYRANPGKFNVDIRINDKGNFFQKLKNKMVETNNKTIYKELIKVIDEFKPYVAHLNNLYGLSPIVWKALKEKGVKEVQTVRDYWFFDGFSYKSKNFLFKMYHKHYFKKYSKFVDIVTAPSLATLDVAKKSNLFKNAKFHFVNNGIEFDLNKTFELINKKKNQNINEYTYLFAGTLVEKKGILNLIEAFNLLKDNKYKLKICGDGPLKDKVIEATSKNSNITYLGKINKEQLYKEYESSNIVVVPSLSVEPFGMVVIEAMINGCVVIGTNYGGIHEIVSNIKGGLEVDPNNINELSNALKAVADTNVINDLLTKIEKSIDCYQIDNTIKKYLELYK
jgi:glycosyltransferase involved in cell wall biosynthesis